MGDQIAIDLIAALFGEDPGRALREDVRLKEVPALVNRALQLSRTEAISPLNVTPYTVLLIEANKGWRARCEELENKLAIASRALQVERGRLEHQRERAHTRQVVIQDAMRKLTDLTMDLESERCGLPAGYAAHGAPLNGAVVVRPDGDTLKVNYPSSAAAANAAWADALKDEE